MLRRIEKCGLLVLVCLIAIGCAKSPSQTPTPTASEGPRDLTTAATDQEPSASDVEASEAAIPEPIPGETIPPATEQPQAAPAADANEESGDSSNEHVQAGEGSVIIIDVRSKDEWDMGHLDKAIHIPHDVISDQIAEVTEDPNAQIILYCRSGGRAGRAKGALEELGYKNVENAGGFEDVRRRFE